MNDDSEVVNGLPDRLAQMQVNIANAPAPTGSPQNIQAIAQKAQPEPHNFAEKIGRGGANIIEGGVQLLTRALPQGLVNTLNAKFGSEAFPTAEQIDKQIESREEEWQANRKANRESGIEVLRGVGSALVAAPALAALPAAAPGLAGALTTGGIMGGISAALEPVYNTRGGYWGKKGGQVAFGTLTGAGTSGTLYGLGRMLAPEEDAYRASVNRLRERGVNPTVGQNIGPRAATAEDAASTVHPAIASGQRRAMEEFNRAAYNEVLQPVGMAYDGPVGHQGVRAVGNALSDAYDDLVPNLRLEPGEELQTALTRALQNVPRMSESAARQFQTILEQDLPRGQLAGQGIKDVQSKITREIGRFSQSNDPSHQMIADSLREINDAIMHGLQRSNPNHAAQLAAIDDGWAHLVRLERAAANTKDGIFTPGTLLNAIKASDNSVRKRAFARGDSLMQGFASDAHTVLGNRYPNSGTFGRAAAATGILGGASAISPTAAAGLAASSLAYTPFGQRTLGAIINGTRPASIQGTGRAIQAFSPYAAPGLIFGMGQ